MEIRKCDPAKSICLDIAFFFLFLNIVKTAGKIF